MNPLDRLTTIISRLMGKNPDDPYVLEAVVEVVMAIRKSSGELAEPVSRAMRRGAWAAVDAAVARADTRPQLIIEGEEIVHAVCDALLTEGEG